MYNKPASSAAVPYKVVTKNTQFQNTMYESDAPVVQTLSSYKHQQQSYAATMKTPEQNENIFKQQQPRKSSAEASRQAQDYAAKRKAAQEHAAKMKEERKQISSDSLDSDFPAKKPNSVPSSTTMVSSNNNSFDEMPIGGNKNKQMEQQQPQTRISAPKQQQDHKYDTAIKAVMANKSNATYVPSNYTEQQQQPVAISKPVKQPLQNSNMATVMEQPKPKSSATTTTTMQSMAKPPSQAPKPTSASLGAVQLLRKKMTLRGGYTEPESKATSTEENQSGIRFYQRNNPSKVTTQQSIQQPPVQQAPMQQQQHAPVSKAQRPVQQQQPTVTQSFVQEAPPKRQQPVAQQQPAAQQPQRTQIHTAAPQKQPTNHKPPQHYDDEDEQDEPDEDEQDEDEDGSDNDAPSTSAFKNANSNSDMPSEYPDEDVVLVPCPECGRTFRQQVLHIHKKSCGKVFGKKRKVFDAKGHRLQEIKNELQSAQAAAPPPEKEKPKPKIPKWKQQSMMLQKTMQDIRGHKPSSGNDNNGLGMVMEIDLDDRKQCPDCGRKFNDNAYDRHITVCKQMKAKPSTLRKGAGITASNAPKTINVAPSPAPKARQQQVLPNPKMSVMQQPQRMSMAPPQRKK